MDFGAFIGVLILAGFAAFLYYKVKNSAPSGGSGGGVDDGTPPNEN